MKPLAESKFFVFGGASLDEPLKEGEGPKINGSVMVAVADTKEEVMEKIKQDVYYETGVWDMDKVSVHQAWRDRQLHGGSPSSRCRYSRSRALYAPLYRTATRHSTLLPYSHSSGFWSALISHAFIAWSDSSVTSTRTPAAARDVICEANNKSLPVSRGVYNSLFSFVEYFLFPCKTVHTTAAPPRYANRDDLLETSRIHTKSGVLTRAQRRIMDKPPPLPTPSSKKRKRKAAAWDNTTKKPRQQKDPASVQHRKQPEIKPVDPSKHSLRDLPGELRNRIYDLTLKLPNDKPIRITSGMRETGEQLGLGLLGTCKAIRKEALGIYLPGPGFRVDVVKLNKNTRREGPLQYFTECYDSRAKAYEAPIRRFLDGTKYTARLNRSFGLKTVERLVFAYYHADPETDQPFLPEQADLVIEWKLQTRPPYFTLGINHDLTSETLESRIGRTMERMHSTISNMVELRSVHQFAVKDVIEISDRFYYSCLNEKVGLDASYG